MKTLLNRFTLPVAVISVLFLFKFLNPFLADPDFYWHMKTGEYIVSNLSIPTTDPFAFTSSGKPWVAHEWLTEVILYIAMQSLNFTGIRLLVAGTLCAAFYLLFKFAAKLVKSETKALIITTAAFAPLMPYWVPRPQIFTFIFFCIYLRILLNYKYFGEKKYFWVFPIIMAFWVNLHGGYVVGIILLLIFLASESIVHFYSDRENKVARTTLSRLGVFTALTCIATLLNPQFFHIWVFPFELMSMEVSKGAISEWRSPDFHLAFYKVHLMLIIAFFLALVYSQKKADLTELVIPLFFISAGLVSQRHLPLMCFALLGFFSAMYRYLELPFGRAYHNSKTPLVIRAAKLEVSGSIAPLINLALFCSVSILIASGSIDHEKDEEVSPFVARGAAKYVKEKGLSGNMFNDYTLGGYLIYALAPTQKVFIDGRADLYGDKFVTDYIQISSGKDGWKEKFESYAIDYVICDKDSALRQILLAEGSFKEGYVDKYHSVLLRRGSQNQTLLGATNVGVTP